LIQRLDARNPLRAITCAPEDIELTDIVALRLDCKECKAAVSLPFNDYKDMPYVCPNCERQCSEFNDRSVKITISEFVRAVNNVVKLTSGKDGTFAFRVEIASGEQL
jgi:hypothetical protein